MPATSHQNTALVDLTASHRLALSFESPISHTLYVFEISAMGREQIVNDVLGASATILKVGSGVGEVIGVPGVKQASDLLLAFIHAVQVRILKNIQLFST